MIMPQNFYELVWIFIIYAFIGWCTEVSYAALDTGKFVNRGFLNGPYCPIYGCGVVIVVAILTPLKENLLILFAGSFLLTSVLEYITGYILEKVFHNKWWDYSDKPFNIKGYVCLKFSIYWGLACTFIMDIIHPIIYAAIHFIPFVLGVVLLSIIMCVFAADCIITVTTILKFNKRLKVMDEMAASIHRLSDEIGENIYENVTDVIEKSEKFQKTHVELMDKISETKENIYGLPRQRRINLRRRRERRRISLRRRREQQRINLRRRQGQRRISLRRRQRIMAASREEKKTRTRTCTRGEKARARRTYGALREAVRGEKLWFSASDEGIPGYEVAG